jgi:NADPH-dependent glutamate synthase beta subunit-like oxidoreductase
LGQCDPQSAFDQQLPGIHRPHLSGALRGSLHAEPRRHPVAIKTVEQAIADKAYEMGFIVPPQPAACKTGKKVAVVGSGPAGMAAAQQLGRAGHDVHVYERESRIGGLLRYGIPDFKMEKHYIDRRVEQMEGEGVTFHCQRQCRRRQDR